MIPVMTRGGDLIRSAGDGHGQRDELGGVVVPGAPVAAGEQPVPDLALVVRCSRFRTSRPLMPYSGSPSRPGQPVLQPRRLTVVNNLLAQRLADVFSELEMILKVLVLVSVLRRAGLPGSRARCRGRRCQSGCRGG